MKVLVTGGGGFLGKRIVELLLEQGAEVRIFNRNRYPAIEALGVEGVVGDLTDYEAVRQACRGMDVVIHTAALADFWGKYETFYQVNVRGTKHIVEACVMENVSRLVYTSSPSVVIGNFDINGGDESLPYPTTWYTAYPQTKAEAEQYVLASNGRQLLNGQTLYTCALRPHMIWGPEDNHIIPTTLDAVRRGKMKIVGTGENKIDITYVDNAAYAHLKVLEALGPQGAASGQAYFIGDEEPVAIWSWLNRLLAMLDMPQIHSAVSFKTAYYLGAIFEMIWRVFRLKGRPNMTRFVALQFSRNHWFSHEKAKRDFGYEPIVDAETALQNLVNSLKPQQ